MQYWIISVWMQVIPNFSTQPTWMYDTNDWSYPSGEAVMLCTAHALVIVLLLVHRPQWC